MSDRSLYRVTEFLELYRRTAPDFESERQGLDGIHVTDPSYWNPGNVPRRFVNPRRVMPSET